MRRPRWRMHQVLAPRPDHRGLEGTVVAVPRGMRRVASSVVFGFMLLILGASIALDLVIDLKIPIVKSTVALVLLVWGSHSVATAWAERNRHA